ncbi:MAG: redoxin domain-containing protein [Bacteroidetes bacterium]|jgi:peroxiredoxin|nr:redoxin domain-containing protein [Bacteroidota bacterium]
MPSLRLVATAALLLILAACGSMDPLRLDRPAKPFSAETIRGETVRLADHEGSVVLLEFWGTWCPPCVGDVPYLQQAYETYADRGFEIIGVANDQYGDLISFLLEHKISWTQVHDPGGNLMRSYLGPQPRYAYPTAILIDEEGIVRATGSELRREQLLITLDEHFASTATTATE